MYTMLHLLPGFCLPDFLEGTRVAYESVMRLMYARDWEALKPLVAPECLSGLTETMDGIAGDTRRILNADAADAIEIQSATLNRVCLLEHGGSLKLDVPRQVHLDVRFVTTERWLLHDYRENTQIKPYDGTPFRQEAIMRWDGEVAKDPHESTRPWRLHGLEMQIAREFHQG